MSLSKTANVSIPRKNSTWKAIKRYKYVYILITPALLLIFLFAYLPLFGIFIAFKDFNPIQGVWGSPWVGFKYFVQFYESFFFWRIIRNTFFINILKLVIGLPLPIIFALLLNEIGGKYFKKIIQTFSYMPHFISWIVVVGLMQSVFSPSMGLMGKIYSSMGEPFPNIFMEKAYFYPIVILSSLWKEFGWGSILYFAAISGLDQQLYEAAKIDGAGRWRQTWHITLPGIKSLIVVLTLLNIGSILNSDFQQLIAIIDQNVAMYELGDVIDTFVWRAGLLTGDYSYGTAIGVLKGVVSLILVYVANKGAKKMGEEGIW